MRDYINHQTVQTNGIDDENTLTDENASPLGKRKTEIMSPSHRNSKRSPLSDIRTNQDTCDTKRKGNVMTTPLKHYPIKTIGVTSSSKNRNYSTPYSCGKLKSRNVQKEEVEATNEGRAPVHILSEWLANESSKKVNPRMLISTKSSATPIRFRTKPKIAREDVEATNEKRVSVKTLSAWISDDPFEQKKVRHIRSGARVIAKARVFESDKTSVELKKHDVIPGSVNEKQAWLSDVFKTSHECQKQQPDDSLQVPTLYIDSDIGNVENADYPSQSVQEKQEWLNNVFKKNTHHSSEIKRSKSSGEELPTLSIRKSASVEEPRSPCSVQTIKSESCASCVRDNCGVDLSYRFDAAPRNAPAEDNMIIVQGHPESRIKSSTKLGPIGNKFAKASPSGKLVKQNQHPAHSAAKFLPPTVSVVEKQNRKPSNDNIVSVDVCNDDENKISVKDRAKWLQSAFNQASQER